MATDNIATLVIGDSKADTELKQLIDFFKLSDKGITVQLHKDSKKLQFQKLPCLIVNGKLVYQYNAIAKFLAANSSTHSSKSEIDWNQIWQYLEYRFTDIQSIKPDNAKIQSVLTEVNSILTDKTFLVGYEQSLADIALYLGLHPIADCISVETRERYNHFSRWFDQNQYLLASTFHLPRVYFSKNKLYNSC